MLLHTVLIHFQYTQTATLHLLLHLLWLTEKNPGKSYTAQYTYPVIHFFLLKTYFGTFCIYLMYLQTGGTLALCVPLWTWQQRLHAINRNYYCTVWKQSPQWKQWSSLHSKIINMPNSRTMVKFLISAIFCDVFLATLEMHNKFLKQYLNVSSLPPKCLNLK